MESVNIYHEDEKGSTKRYVLQADASVPRGGAGEATAVDNDTHMRLEALLEAAGLSIRDFCGMHNNLVQVDKLSKSNKGLTILLFCFATAHIVTKL